MTDTIDNMIKAIILDKNFIRKFCDNVLFKDEKWNEKYEYHNNDDVEYNEELEEYNYFEEYADDHIIYPLFNDYVAHFVELIIDKNIDWRERNEIFKYVLEKAKDYDMVDEVITYHSNDDWRKLCDLYAYHKAKELMFNDEDNALQYDFDKLVNEYYAELQHTQLVMDTSFNIAIKKVMRSDTFYLGLSKQLSMRDCGIELSS